MEGPVSVHFVHVPDRVSFCDLSHWAQFLDDEERNTLGRYRVEFKKIEFLVGRMLLKSVLSHPLQLPTKEIRFSKTSHGKLFLHGGSARGPDQEDIHFNLSHTTNFVACAVATTPVGIDVEILGDEYPHFGSMVFTRNELAYLAGRTGILKKQAFYELWTRKEAYLKGLGTGLSIDPKSIEVPFGRPQSVRHGWEYHTVTLLGTYVLSVAVQRDSPCALPVDFHEVAIDDLDKGV